MFQDSLSSQDNTVFKKEFFLKVGEFKIDFYTLVIREEERNNHEYYIDLTYALIALNRK
jgi:hypothetical protein